MRKTIILSSLFVLTFSSIVWSCKKKITAPSVAECATLDAKYSTTVKTIIDTKCASSNCHDGSNSEIKLKTFDDVKQHYTHMLSEINSGRMPKGGITLSTTELKQLQCWLQDGAKNN
jgi:hypothetical protein